MSAPAGCPFCSGAQPTLVESPRWRILRHADPVPLVGWMMIAARAHRAGLDELSAEESAELGVVLGVLAKAVRSETRCERTYAISFNEAVPHLHVHVVPRHANDPTTTSWALADRYRATMREELAPASIEEAERTARAIAQRALPALQALGFVAPHAP